MTITRRSILKGAAALAASAGFIKEAGGKVLDGFVLDEMTTHVHTTPLVVPCDGRRLLKRACPELWALLGECYGPADDDYFCLPDLRGAAISPFGEVGPPVIFTRTERFGDMFPCGSVFPSIAKAIVPFENLQGYGPPTDK